MTPEMKIGTRLRLRAKVVRFGSEPNPYVGPPTPTIRYNKLSTQRTSLLPKCTGARPS